VVVSVSISTPVPAGLYPSAIGEHVTCTTHIAAAFFYVSLTVHLSITLANDQLDAQILIYLLQSSICACFEQYFAHPQ